MLAGMKYDFYESFTDGSGEHKLTKQQLNRLFTRSELKEMVSTGFEIVRGNLKYWSEEAMVYSQGIAIN